MVHGGGTRAELSGSSEMSRVWHSQEKALNATWDGFRPTTRRLWALHRGDESTTQTLCQGVAISVAVVNLESDEPVQSVPIDYLTVGCSPRSLLQVIHNPSAFREPSEPLL